MLMTGAESVEWYQTHGFQVSDAIPFALFWTFYYEPFSPQQPPVFLTFIFFKLGKLLLLNIDSYTYILPLTLYVGVTHKSSPSPQGL